MIKPRALIAEHTNIFEHPVIVAQAGASDDTQAKLAAQDGNAGANIVVDEFSADDLQATVTNPAGRRAWLVYADAFAPYWTASIDGKPQTISRVNLAFKAIPIPPGSHVIRFALNRSFSGIILLGGVTLFGLLVLLSGLALCHETVRKASALKPR